jgi:hypothetical protein
MKYAEYLRDEADEYRRRAEKTKETAVKQELLDLAAVCEDVAARVEDELASG